MSNKNNNEGIKNNSKSFYAARKEKNRQEREAKRIDEQNLLRAAAKKRQAEIAGDKENRRLQNNLKKLEVELAAREKAQIEFEKEIQREKMLNRSAMSSSKTGGVGRRISNSRSAFNRIYNTAATSFIFSRLTHKEARQRLNGVKTRIGLSKQKQLEKNNFASVNGQVMTKSKARAAERHNLRKELEELSAYLHENTIAGLTQLNYEKQFASIDELSRRRKKQLDEKLTPYENQKKLIEKLKKKKTKAFKEFRRDDFKKLSAELDFQYKELKRLKEKYKSLIYSYEQKHENVGFEQFLVLSEYQYTKLEEQVGAFEARELFAARVEKMMQAMKDRFGFEPSHYAIHLDEGHIDLETGNFSRNIHAQAIYYSYDFKNNVGVMNKIRNEVKANPDIPDGKWLKLLGETQNDLWGAICNDLGFQRGYQKKYSKVDRVHSEKLAQEKYLKVISEYDQATAEAKVSISQAEKIKQESEKLFGEREEKIKKNVSLLKEKIAEFERRKKIESLELKSKVKKVKEKMKELESKEDELSKKELEVVRMKHLLEEPKRAINIQSTIFDTLRFYEDTIKEKNIDKIRYVSDQIIDILSDNFDTFYNQEIEIDEEMFLSISNTIENELIRVSKVETQIKKELENNSGFDKRIDFNNTPMSIFNERTKRRLQIK